MKKTFIFIMLLIVSSNTSQGQLNDRQLPPKRTYSESPDGESFDITVTINGVSYRFVSTSGNMRYFYKKNLYGVKSPSFLMPMELKNGETSDLVEYPLAAPSNIFLDAPNDRDKIMMDILKEVLSIEEFEGLQTVRSMVISLIFEEDGDNLAGVHFSWAKWERKRTENGIEYTKSSLADISLNELYKIEELIRKRMKYKKTEEGKKYNVVFDIFYLKNGVFEFSENDESWWKKGKTIKR